MSRTPLQNPLTDWWTRVTGARFTRYELAGCEDIPDWPRFAASLFGTDAPSESNSRSDAPVVDWLDYVDAEAGIYRTARIVEGRLDACLFVAPKAQLPTRTWLAGLFDQAVLDPADRKSLLAGRAATASVDAGPQVCSCFGVGRNTIVDAIRKLGLTSPNAVTTAVKAGGNCGSCLPEIRRLLQDIATSPAAVAPSADSNAAVVNALTDVSQAQ